MSTDSTPGGAVENAGHHKPRDPGTAETTHQNAAIHDLRGFMQTVETQSARELLRIDEPVSSHFELAAITSELVKKMRMPIIRYQQVEGTSLPVIHNVCASLSRIAKSMGWTVPELENRLESAYDALIPPVSQASGPVRDKVLQGEAVNLKWLPAIRYTETETHPYLSAFHVVVRDPSSNTLNVSVHRMMLISENALTIYMTPGGHLDTIFQANAQAGRDTPIAAFCGAHPLWSLGALAAGTLELDELSVIGGLLGYPLSVVPGLINSELQIPAHSELVLEGVLSHTELGPEGPYGEAFGFVSERDSRPMFRVQAMSHRDNPLFQDIVPGQLEHLTMTGICTQVHLKKTLFEQYDCITRLFLPTPMTVHISISRSTEPALAHGIIRRILVEHRFVKHVILFDDEVDISHAKQTQNAIAMHVQAHRDTVILPGMRGNGLDPSELDGKTTKWGIDASGHARQGGVALRNQIPQSVVDALDIKALLERAMQR